MALQYLKFLTLSLIALVICAFPRVGAAANYYVDYDGGLDSNLGTSKEAAFKHCPGDINATGIASSSTLSPGDTVFFKGGVKYLFPGRIVLKWSGSDGSPITYEGNANDAWGTGRAIMTDNHYLYSGSGIGSTCFHADSSRSHLVFKNFEFAELGGSAAPPSDTGSPILRNTGAGFNFSGGANSIVIQDCYFREIGYYWNVKPMNEASLSGIGIQTINCNGLTITNCEFTRVAIPLEMFGNSLVTNLTIVDCYFHNAIKWCVDIASGSSAAKFGAIEVKNCKFYNFGEFGSGTWTGYGEWPHVDGIFLRCDYQGTQYSTNIGPTGINFHGNTFWDTNQASANGTACIYITAGPSANAYNNQFIHTIKSRTIYVNGTAINGTTPQTVRIYNNTFVESYQNAIDLASNSGGNARASLIDIRNNIMVDLKADNSSSTLLYFQVVSPSTNFICDYNLYHSLNPSGQWIRWDGVGSGGLNILHNQGLEQHGLAIDPKFVNISYGVGGQCNLNDLRLQSSSPARDAGTILPSFFARDKIGVMRPVGSSFDRGAYEFRDSNDANPLPPIELRLGQPSQ